MQFESCPFLPKKNESVLILRDVRHPAIDNCVCLLSVITPPRDQYHACIGMMGSVTTTPHRRGDEYRRRTKLVLHLN